MSPTESKSNPSTPIYLYGAAVQGIQGFIFQTNELKDIVGASELVEEICTNMFKDEFKQDGELIVSAAGNIKCLFNSEVQCRAAVMSFPMAVMKAAPGITISQAVIKTSEDEIVNSFQSVVNRLEERLRAQRNKVSKSLTTGLMAIERSRKTGLPAVRTEEDKETKTIDFLDNGTALKKARSKKGGATLKLCSKSFGKDVTTDDVALDINKLTNHNDWIAIIHADGNGLGAILATHGGDKEKLHNFSINLSVATEAAAQKAYNEISDDSDSIIPIRPVVLGGDDHTVICRADIAIPYTKSFLAHFEKETAKLNFNLTACAGIAFIKSSYPFHYGYDLAEMLCSRAKKDAKSKKENGRAPSCLMFHKVQSSFVEQFDDIAARELTPCENNSFEFGPYYLNEQNNRWSIDKLMEKADMLSTKGDSIEDKDGNAVKSDIRNWMTLMHDSVENAEKRKRRVLQQTMQPLTMKWHKLFKEATTSYQRGDMECYPAYDILSITTINNLQTK